MVYNFLLTKFFNLHIYNDKYTNKTATKLHSTLSLFNLSTNKLPWRNLHTSALWDRPSKLHCHFIKASKYRMQILIVLKFAFSAYNLY